MESKQNFQDWKLGLIMRFIYGPKNAERLSYIIDQALEKVELYKKLCDCKQPSELEGVFLNSIEKEKKEEYNFDKSRYYRIITNENKASEFRIVLWHMILIGILSITKSDLNFDFGIEKTNIDSHLHDLIYNYVASDKFKNEILSFLAVDEHPYPFFCLIYTFFLKSLKVESFRNDAEPEFFKKICVCFLKVAFYKMREVVSPEEQKDNNLLGNWQNKWQSLVYNLKRVFYFHKKNTWRTKSMAQYLYLTRELEDWWKRHNSEFIGCFCSDVAGPSQSRLFLNFRAFLPYLNKIEPLSEKYKKTENFWKMFFPAQISGYKVACFGELNLSFINIAAYLNSDQAESVLLNLIMSCLTEMITENQLLDTLRTFKEKREFNSDKLNECVVDSNERIKIKEKELSSYFDALIIRFCEMNGKNRSTDDKNLIKQVSQIIINSQGTQSEKSVDKSQNKFIYDKFSKVSAENNKFEKENPKFNSKGEDQNQNEINFVNQGPNSEKNKNSYVSANNSITIKKITMSEQSIFNKINTSLDSNDKMPSLQQTNLRQNK